MFQKYQLIEYLCSLMALCSAIAFHWLGLYETVRWHFDCIYANIENAYLHYPKICGWHNLITYCIHIIHLNDILHRRSDSHKEIESSGLVVAVKFVQTAYLMTLVGYDLFCKKKKFFFSLVSFSVDCIQLSFLLDYSLKITQILQSVCAKCSLQFKECTIATVDRNGTVKKRIWFLLTFSIYQPHMKVF